MPFELRIQLFDDGSCRVDGCIKNKIISYGMLQVAHDLIVDYHKNNPNDAKQPTQADMEGFVSNGQVN